MAIGKRAKKNTKKIPIPDLTNEQRKKFAIVANKADEKRFLSLKKTEVEKILSSGKKLMAKNLIKRRNSNIRYIIWLITFIIFCLWLMYML